MKPKSLAAGQIVQLNPATVRDTGLAACLLIVFECRDWGIIGYTIDVSGPRQNRKTMSNTYYRAAWDEMEEITDLVHWGIGPNISGVLASEFRATGPSYPVKEDEVLAAEMANEKAENYVVAKLLEDET